MQVVQTVFTEDQLLELRALSEVEEAYQKLDKRSSVYFTIPMISMAAKALENSFGLDLSTHQTIPCRWIKGDTPAHIDRGSSSFDKTYLVYLTDGEGTFRIEDESYPIEAGTGFSFPEGLSHEVTGTNGSTRLLLGPMSEEGFPVGGINIFADGATDTVYLRDNAGTVEYRINEGDWQSVPFACYVGNSNADPANNPLKFIFTTNLTLTSWNQNFWCATDGLQFGSQSVNADGTRPTITISNAPNYRGLILNGTVSSNGYNHISIYNLSIVATGTSTLDDGTNTGYAGWVGGPSYARGASNNYIVNCSSDGPIGANNGGIVGIGAAESGGSLTIRGCSSYGSIGGIGSGGIAGSSAGSSGGSVTCEQCWSEGPINAQDAGGIFGYYAGVNQGYALAVKCYSTGTIASDGGGIFGGYAGESIGQAQAQSCYSQGEIGSSAGGIFSRYAGYNFGTTTATNCYSSGSILGYGIYGVNQQAGATSTNCYAANNSWSDSTANLNLTGVPGSSGVGTAWVKQGSNAPYELNGIGYTPYTTTIINSSSELIQSYSQNITPGQSTVSALAADASGNAFELLRIEGGVSASYTTITMSAQTGSITTTSATAVGTYTITLRSVGSYNITTFVLTISPDAEAATGTTTTCCTTTINERGIDYAQIVNYRIGNRLLLEVSQNPKTTFDGYSQYVKYKMAQGSRKV